MRIFTNVTMSSNVSMASNAKDTFTIGSELERNNPDADSLKVWANANFYNDVTLGSSSNDIVTINAQLTASDIKATSISASGISEFETAQFNNVVITAGNIDGTVIGDNYQNTGHFTSLTASVGFNTDVLIFSGSHLETVWSSYNVSWTSSGTQPSLGNGTLTGYYKQIGKTVFVRVKLDWGSTTTGGTGDWRFSLPVSAVSAEAIQMPCSILDNGNAWYQATVNGRYSGLTDRSSLIGQSSGSNSSQGIDSTFPITWGNGDSLQFNGSYEAA